MLTVDLAMLSNYRARNANFQACIAESLLRPAA
jgi:hypothetical protein